MGGPGSGRWGDYKKRSIVEYESSRAITLEFPNGSTVKASLDYPLDPAFGKPVLTLTYSVGEDSQTLQIRLQKTSPHSAGFGGGSPVH